MTIGVVATLTIQEGKNAEFEQAFLGLAEQVRANEPGNLFYLLHRSRENPQEYKVLEQYTSDADLQAHRESDHFKAANATLAPFMAAMPIVEVLDAL
ncbi:MAG: putative quinol monooxygenase [Pseudomonadota bacterium]